TDTTVTVTLSCKDGILLSVADNGSGMTAEELDGLFRRYYRGTSTEVQTEGTGLGMAIARQIIEAHSGKIEATSTVGEGTSVEIRLHTLNTQ
ncbi:MAG: ATP-binding protein, partial [bacterium]|nr:ATP-binding protein [bacterium]